MPEIDWLKDITWHLAAVNIAVREVSLFIGARPKIPPGDGPFVNVSSTGGMSPLKVHDSLPGIRQPSGMLVARAMTSAPASQKARDAWYSLGVLRNVTLNGTFYTGIYVEEIYELPLDPRNMSRYAFNFRAVRP